MSTSERPLRVFYSFPHKLGAARICTTAWHQVEGLMHAGLDVRVVTASICRPLPPQATVETTLALGRLRLPSRILGTYRNCLLHDWLAARRLRRLAGKVDVVHVWPLGAKRTIAVAKELGIPSFLERPNAHTRYAYQVVQDECRKLGISMPEGHEHAFNPRVLAREEEEYAMADYLLCPSDFVARTFAEKGFPPAKLLRHQYGFDQRKYYYDPAARTPGKGLRVLFAGGCAPRKGLHYALEAWLGSSASKDGEFLIAGGFIPGYAECLGEKLRHPSVKVLGHRNDVPDLMRKSDILILPSIEEGSALVTSEARGCGCVLLVSDAAGAICTNGFDSLVHSVGDVGRLKGDLDSLNVHRELLEEYRNNSLRGIDQLTWLYAGERLAALYRSFQEGGA